MSASAAILPKTKVRLVAVRQGLDDLLGVLDPDNLEERESHRALVAVHDILKNLRQAEMDVDEVLADDEPASGQREARHA